MPKLFYPYLILLSLVFLNCQGDLDEDFDHWDLINSDTKNIIFLNNINTGVQDLNLKENISSELSIPAFSPALNQLIDNLDIQTSGFLILNESDDPFNFYLVLKHKDLINEIKKTSIYTFDQDTIFRHHRGNYDIFSIDRELPAIKDNTPGFIPEALVKLFDLKKDKPVVVAKKITQVNESDLLSGSWIVYEYKSNNFGVSANGIILPKTEITYPKSKLANILKLTEGQRPTSLSSDQIIPSNFNSSISIAINNPESFNKIIKQADSSLTAAAFFETLQEINLIQIDKKTAIAVKSLDLNLSMKAFVSELTGQINFRGINIQRFQAIPIKQMILYF